jgi:para-nitrobenzyl esterase
MEKGMKELKQGSGTINRRSLLAGFAGIGAVNVLGASTFARALSPATEVPIASTECGKVRGVVAKQVLSFRGIPYGGPTEGKNRFLPPSKAIPWKGIREATRAGPRSMQNKDKTTGDKNIFSAPLIGEYFSGGRKDAPEITFETNSENCLILNVLTPGLQGKRPVMVYIHGGGFAIGSGALTLISDRFVSEQDVVLVGVNHRLNVFGYTYLGELDPAYADSGNVGQLDLIAALQWVKETSPLLAETQPMSPSLASPVGAVK